MEFIIAGVVLMVLANGVIAWVIWEDARFTRNRALYVGDEAKRDQHTAVRRKRLKALQARFWFRKS